MKILFDALGATEHSGGMKLHAHQVISTWLEEFPADEVHVVGPTWTSNGSFAPAVIHPYPNESVFARASGQLLYTGLLSRQIRADATISLSPIVSPLARHYRVAFQHDWRHIKIPREFSRIQRMYRKLWKSSSRWADINACISQKAIEETLAISPRAKVALVPNGADHAGHWTARREPVEGRITTFGHHNNKRPELAIRSLAIIRARGVGVHLVVLGARGPYRERLRMLAEDNGVADLVSFPGFVTDEEYQAYIASSQAIALLSSDEGYGLPVAEALHLAIPAVVTNDSGIRELFDGYPIECSPAPESVADAFVAAITRDTQPTRTLTTWSDTVSALRTLISPTQ